jgi:hypothetical protein
LDPFTFPLRPSVRKIQSVRWQIESAVKARTHRFVWQGSAGHLVESLAALSVADFTKRRSLLVRDRQAFLQLAPQDPIFGSQVLIV